MTFPPFVIDKSKFGLLTSHVYLCPIVQIKPLVQPTKDIMKEPIRTFKWHEFFPHGIPRNDDLLLDILIFA